MKVEDLMIGDWYYWEAEGKKYPMQVTKDTFKLSDEDISNFQPIPLTPEIIEKYGFIYRGLPSQQYWELNNLFIYNDKPYYMFCGCRSIDLYYVHDLQHILKLCEIDKEIVV